MLRTMMKGKIHRATVTDSNIDYQGSITIDEALLEMAAIIPYEQVDIYNITNGERFTTYAIIGPPGLGRHLHQRRGCAQGKERRPRHYRLLRAVPGQRATGLQAEGRFRGQRQQADRGLDVKKQPGAPCAFF